MRSIPEPIWPVVMLAVIQLGDAVICIKPVRFVVECYRGVRWPTHLWWVMPPIKFAAALGLTTGIWVPWLGLVSNIALIAYFLSAIAMHLWARDFGRNLFVNASGMLALCIIALTVAFIE